VNPDHREPGQGEALVTQPVLVECPARGVDVTPVGLDDEALRAPEEVGLVGDPAAQSQEPLLETLLRKRRPRVVGKHGAEHSCAAAAARSGDGTLHRTEIEEAPHLRLVDGALDLHPS
jgi:hypothetical protein